MRRFLRRADSGANEAEAPTPPLGPQPNPDPVLKELQRLRELPRHQPDETRLLGIPLSLNDGPSFASAYEAIFVREQYAFRPRDENPRILDCGAHVGLGSVYWGRAFPDARISAFEPDPVVFQYLEANCRAHLRSRPELVMSAVWTSGGSAAFLSDQTDSGRLQLGGPPLQGAAELVVPTVRLRDYLTEPVDLLKLDVEGAELAVLQDIEDLLPKVDHLFIEAHAFDGQSDPLWQILSILTTNRFSFYAEPEFTLTQPFLSETRHKGMTGQTNIFATRHA